MTKQRSPLGKLVKALVFLVLAFVAVALVAIWQIGAWGILFPSHEHDSVAPNCPPYLNSPAVLVFSKTNSFRHKDGISAGNTALQEMAEKQNWGIYSTENGAIFNPQDLSRFGVVVFLNATGDILNAEQEQAFQQWVEQGGGWLGLHAAGDGSHAGWQWYRDNLIGADFTAHILDPQFQRATVVLENHLHPVLKGLPDIWQHIEEWYSWEKSPRAEGFTILATLDETSYAPVQKFLGNERDLSMGDHPVVWSNCIGEGRSVYAAMGHTTEAFEQPQVHTLIRNSIAWLMDSTGRNCAEAALPK
jgi:type 1 glutamine amidotransferase